MTYKIHRMSYFKEKFTASNTHNKEENVSNQWLILYIKKLEKIRGTEKKKQKHKENNKRSGKQRS